MRSHGDAVLGLDLQGGTEFPAEICQRVVAQFEDIIEEFWEGFRNLREAKSRKHIFDGLDPYLARAFGDCLLFTAEALAEKHLEGEHRRYKILRWQCTVDEGVQPELSKRPSWADDFESRFLDQASDSAEPSVFASPDMALDGGHLGEVLHNLAVSPIWFEGEGALYLGVSLLEHSKDRDVWLGPNKKILDLFPELLASPLRVENHYSQLEAFRTACRDGLAVEVTRLGKGIMSSRLQLAWRASRTQFGKGWDEPPTVSGEYDALIANYLDAERFAAATAQAEPGGTRLMDAVSVFGRLFSPSRRDGVPRLVLHAASDCDSREATFVVAEEATRARHAIGRSLVWLAYKAGVMNRDAAGGWECPFPRHHEVGDAHQCCRTLLDQDYGEAAPQSEDVIDLDGVRVSWLRYLWVEIFYRSRQIQENRRESSEELLSELAEKYSRAIKSTREAFPRILAARQDTDSGLRVDWRWLYLWFLANAMNSQALEKEYGSYDQDRHGFWSHLGHYRDASTAVLFGLHLVRFWDGAVALELWDLPELRPDEVMQARLRLLCEYAYREIGVDRTWQLEQHLLAQFQPEMVLQATSPAHREHALHVMDVCQLGHLLVGSYGAGETPSQLQQKILGQRSAPEFLRMWYPAALLHDVGRAQEVAHSVLELLNNFGTPDLREYAEAVQTGIDEAHVRFDKAIIKQFKSLGLDLATPIAGISCDHGVVSANHIIHSLKGTAGDVGFLKKDDTTAILRAIAKHNRRCESFGAAVEPLSYLLVLSDHLQEWSRPRFPAQQLAMSFLGSTQISTPFTVKGQRAAHWLAPEGKYSAKLNGIVFPEDSIRLRLRCAPPKSSLFEPACLWVNTTADLERIWFDDGYPVVELVFVHPRSEVLLLSRSGAFEMELLRDFAVERGAFLSTWLQSVDANRDGLSYERNRGEKVERFTLRVGVRKEGAPRLLVAIPKDFYSQFVRSKERQLGSAGEE